MTITISEIKNDYLKKAAQKEDLNGDGVLNKEEFDSLFDNMNKSGKIIKPLSKAGDICSYIMMGGSAIGLAMTPILKSPKVAGLFALSGLLGIGGKVLFTSQRNNADSALKELETLREMLETPVADNNNIEVEI